MTVESVKTFLSSPGALFVMMILASVANGSKQLAVIRQTGQPISSIDYWAHLPETLATFFSNVMAFSLLLMTDQLNFASALSVGYGLNSLSDLLTKGGRSYTLKSTPDDPSKVPK